MSDCAKCRLLFTEALYEELNDDQRIFLSNHLKSCKKCESEFAEMSSTLKIMNQRIRPEPEQAFWDGFNKRLAERMEKEDALKAKPDSWWRSLIHSLKVVPNWAYQAAAALLLIVIGIYIGKMMFTPSVSEIQQARQVPSLVSQTERGAALIHRTQNYIERSKLILLAIVNFDPETEDPYALNLPYQQQISKQLVREASSLKKELADSDQRRLQNLIMDLEVILLQIANLESEQDSEVLGLIKRGVESQEILLKIHILNVRQSIEKRNQTIHGPKDSNRLQNL